MRSIYRTRAREHNNTMQKLILNYTHLHEHTHFIHVHEHLHYIPYRAYFSRDANFANLGTIREMLATPRGQARLIPRPWAWPGAEMYSRKIDARKRFYLSFAKFTSLEKYAVYLPIRYIVVYARTRIYIEDMRTKKVIECAVTSERIVFFS